MQEVSGLTGKRITNFIHCRNIDKHINTFTFVMFTALVVEKLASGASMRLAGGKTYFDFSFSVADVLQLLVYVSMAVLISRKVKHKYLLLPDFVLLCIKLYAAVSGLVTLFGVHYSNVLSELSVLEKTVESILFSLFLVFLFAGKLIHSERAPVVCPMLCLGVLAFCVPVTVVFEILKLIVEEQMNYPLHMEIFIFLKGVLNETFLDLPYAMLILLVFYCHKDEKTVENL